MTINISFAALFVYLVLGCSSKNDSTDTNTDTDDTHTTTNSTECDFHLPEVGSTWTSDTGDVSTSDTGMIDLGELSEEGLIAHWPLNGDWSDIVGGYDLTPLRAGGFSSADYAFGGDNQAYGPGWEASQELTGRQPRTESELNSSLWGMP